jgi:hypothetical protein
VNLDVAPFNLGAGGSGLESVEESWVLSLLAFTSTQVQILESVEESWVLNLLAFTVQKYKY